MILFICNTSYQVFNAINMKIQLHSDEEVDLIISEHSNLDSILPNIKETGLFRKIWKTDSLYLARKFYFFDDFEKYEALMKPEKYIKNCLDIDYLLYDKIYTANIDGYINLIYRYHVVNETDCEFAYYEDGWSTYTTNWRGFAYSPYEKYFHEVLGEKLLQKDIKVFYVYEPELGCFKNEFLYTPIPKIDKKNDVIKQKMNTAFGYKPTSEYDKRCIFLEEAFEQDGYKNNDVELVEFIAKTVGEEELLLKRHPRLLENRFKESNIRINTDFSVPWEVHILNNVFSNKLLFTVTSGAVLTPRLIFNDTSFTVYLRDLLEGTVSRIYKTKEFGMFITNFRRKFPNELFIPKTKQGVNICIDAIQKEMQIREYHFSADEAKMLD